MNASGGPNTCKSRGNMKSMQVDFDGDRRTGA